MQCPACGEPNIQGVDLCASCGFDLAGHDLPVAEQGLRGALLSDRVADLAITPPVVVGSEASVATAVEAMRAARQGCALVVDDGELVGIFNERHLLSRVLRRELDPAATPIGDVMSPDPVRLDPDDPPAYAVHCMVSRDFRHLPVVEDGELRGFISVRNILRYLKERLLAA